MCDTPTHTHTHHHMFWFSVTFHVFTVGLRGRPMANSLFLLIELLFPHKVCWCQPKPEQFPNIWGETSLQSESRRWKSLTAESKEHISERNGTTRTSCWGFSPLYKTDCIEKLLQKVNVETIYKPTIKLLLQSTKVCESPLFAGQGYSRFHATVGGFILTQQKRDVHTRMHKHEQCCHLKQIEGSAVGEFSNRRRTLNRLKCSLHSPAFACLEKQKNVVLLLSR